MKRKEKKQLAEKIAKYEKIVQSTDDKDKIKEAESKIMELSTHVYDLEDMVEIDEMVQDLLAD